MSDKTEEFFLGFLALFAKNWALNGVSKGEKDREGRMMGADVSISFSYEE
ncbi:MAG: hypothetical protein ACI4U2_01755 [Christensenellaceae bacterium]